ncbi:MAG: PrsW family glutamic-type intramembrane protease [Saprospiraceae bacterium]|nr:PrsW family glutamic-type intramembrane protease [Saprospiraceae bacterium]MDZ4706577.1 PrsW family glutamic-type intramembrane protease [Saprospiraceae bacterium]
MTPLLFLLAALPGVLLSWYIYRADKFEQEPRLPIVLCFVLGALATWPALQAEIWAHAATGVRYRRDVLSAGLHSFGIVALTEEGIKWLCLLAYPFFRSFFNEPMDGILYAVLIAMGFATMENIAYANQFGISTTVMRGFTAVPAHGAFAVIMGYYAGKAKFDPVRRWRLLLQGLLVAVLVHGTYDFLFVQELYSELVLLAAGVLGLSVYYAQRLIREHQNNSPFRK